MHKPDTLFHLFKWLGKASDSKHKSEYEHIDFRLIHCIGSYIFATNGHRIHYCENRTGVPVGSYSAFQQWYPLSGKLSDYTFHFFRIVPVWPDHITLYSSDIVRMQGDQRYLCQVKTPCGQIQFLYNDLITAMDHQPTAKLWFRHNQITCRLDLPDKRSAILMPIR
ncbi:protein of unknown function [Acidithiobacillus ferrivorans]|uniref:Uncharacterized protein n=1 Tax=Acidithiobacillus ferrivorans TaxID=160808 RepID=A0A060UQX5_9PROT|nr:hypothetical protein [Acidithiobacillus ferrivorans]CDQ09213.1 hypothetical protein AFERRI_240047 [Acidithiobacillus ferrivorans]SMH64880.1 protein of unknown function [Acidithiobacillus ferrivorans]